MAEEPASGFREYRPSGEWRPGTLVALTVVFAAAFVLLAGWYQTSLLDGSRRAFAQFGAGFGAALVLVAAATFAVRWSHCRHRAAAGRAGLALSGAFWLATWGAALAAARDALPPDPAPGWLDLLGVRWDLRTVPWLVWPFEAALYLAVGWAAADNAAEEPYCEDVGRWAKSRRLGVAREVDARAMREAVRDGSLRGVFAAAAARGGGSRVRFELLTAPGSRRQFLKVTLLSETRRRPSDDDGGEDLVGAAVLTTEERQALEEAFAPTE